MNKKGFTLIEILLVVAIISALAAMVVPRLTGRSEKAKMTAARADIRANIATGLKMYEIDMGTFPTTAEGLEALFQAPSSGSNSSQWNGPYLTNKPVDPWGRPYKYKSPGTHNPNGYDLFSVGRDGVESNDDIGNWD
ncbi:MAG: type II secretion system protein GspG [Deltaproteobacteria bacterium RIFCSPLOWO2_02_FULL_46_8]|nr:MAG: type II secretion system protein GspG [Deltaproteobacteria bacterium RIFCSPLOWO2_02_FULL_46_8]